MEIARGDVVKPRSCTTPRSTGATPRTCADFRTHRRPTLQDDSDQGPFGHGRHGTPGNEGRRAVRRAGCHPANPFCVWVFSPGECGHSVGGGAAQRAPPPLNTVGEGAPTVINITLIPVVTAK